MEYKILRLNITPAELLERLRGRKNVFLLESSLRDKERGRYSFVGYDPFAVESGHDLKAFARLKQEFQKFASKPLKGATPFPAGIMGYLSYDFGLEFEGISRRRGQIPEIPGFRFGFYDSIITIDHFKKQVIVSASGLPEKKPGLRQERAAKRLKEIEELLLRPSRILEPVGHARLPGLKSNSSRANYCRNVVQALEHIRQGDIYQVNLAQEFFCVAKGHVDTVALYRALQELSPSCYGGYLDAGPFQIISSSPELFLTLQSRRAETRPMKGTRPRGITRVADHDQRRELWQNPKEKAELLMVTDLERNDLGRVCEFGSVKVKKIREIEPYRTVFQATATVAGKLAEGKNGFDLLQACFPGGSVTGCPKIRAMQIIDELEGSRRGIYTGAMGYMSFSGDLAFNVLIRTILVNGKKVSFLVGSGIVADSNPGQEYEETLVKAEAMRKSLEAV